MLAETPGIDVVPAADFSACIMAAVTAELTEAPGGAALVLRSGVRQAVDGLAHAARDRSPLIVSLLVIPTRGCSRPS